MKLKYTYNDFQGAYPELKLGQEYYSDLCMDSQHSYYINGKFYPKEFFEKI